ncbi:hypothetical protein AWH56_020040 [Anaerobacillus isosaccharinicus]|uniref:Uncharacterized protein n=1 Tax=Anaerobacillus isosaccharinicus TaxID=1532552 RepID=A0A7S7L5T3_9BACI|nr:hypothetical protein [Anaerobacillus isosaccharinicus]
MEPTEPAASANIDGELVATVAGTEISKKDVLLQYPFEEGYIEMYLKEEIIKLEAQKLGVLITQDSVDYLKAAYYPGLDQEEDKDFFETQALELGMEAEDYYNVWATTYIERNAYLQEYIQINFDEPTSDAEADIWRENITNHFNELVAEYKSTGQLVIN